MSEYDCGTTSLLNSLAILYQRDEIPVEIIRIIYKNTLDCKYKVIGDCGTSKKAMRKICKKINKFSKRHNFDLNFKYLSKKECSFNFIKYCINNGGVVIVRSLHDLEHYFLITDIIKDFVYIWDPYLVSETFEYYNKKIEINLLNNEEKINYSLGPINDREIILITKTLLKNK